jgi:hypothetical protein
VCNDKGLFVFDFTTGKEKPVWQLASLPNKKGFIWAHGFYGNVISATTNADGFCDLAVFTWDWTTGPPGDGSPLSEIRPGGERDMFFDQSQVVWNTSSSELKVAKFPN